MQNINLDIVPGDFLQVLRFSQGDIGREFKINLVNYDIPAGATVKLQGTKPSGFGFTITNTGSITNNAITLASTSEMTSEAGKFQAEVHIEKDGVKLGTANLYISVEKDPHPNGTTDGNAEEIIPELTLLVERVEAAASSVLDMQVVANTLPAGSQATYSYDEDENKATFGIPQGEAGAGAAGVVATAYSASSTYAVGDYVIHNSNLYRCTTAITTAEAFTAAHWTQVVLADDVNDLKSDLQNQIQNIEVEGYEATSPNLEGWKLYLNKIIGGNGSMSTVSGWIVVEAEVEPLTKYLITGTASPLFVVKDEDDNVIEFRGGTSYGVYTDVEYLTPQNAKKIYINGYSATRPSIRKYTVNFVMKDEPNGITIEGFSPYSSILEGTLYANSLWNNGNMSTVSGWTVLEADIVPNTKYLISATGNPAFSIVDGDGNLMYAYTPGSWVQITDYEYVAPPNASKIYINRSSNAIPVAKFTNRLKFVKSGQIATKKGGGVYEIGTGKFANEIALNGSNNGLFNFSKILYNTLAFKSTTDDISPVEFGGCGYVGANHGFNYGYDLTISSHGLTEADIGKTYNDGTNTWVLIKIKSTSVIEVVCYDSTKWYRVKDTTPPDTVNFGSSLTVTASERVQIYPSVKNGSVEVAKDSDGVFTVVETYDIIDIGVGIEALLQNVGSNTNDSLVTLSDSVASIRNTYEFVDSGAVTVYQNFKMLKDNVGLNAYGGIQSMAFSTSDYFIVPETSFSFRAVNGNTSSFARSTWDDETKPPKMYVQFSDLTGTRAMFVGYAEVEDRNDNINDSAGWINGSSAKMYPNLTAPGSAVGKGKTYNSVSFRVPCSLQDFGVDYLSYFKVYNDYYVLISQRGATSQTIKLPKLLWNKKVKGTALAVNCTCKTVNIIDSIDFEATDKCFMLLKIGE